MSLYFYIGTEVPVGKPKKNPEFGNESRNQTSSSRSGSSSSSSSSSSGSSVTHVLWGPSQLQRALEHTTVDP